MDPKFIWKKIEAYPFARLLCLLACRQILPDNCVSSSLKSYRNLKRPGITAKQPKRRGSLLFGMALFRGTQTPYGV